MNNAMERRLKCLLFPLFFITFYASSNSLENIGVISEWNTGAQDRGGITTTIFLSSDAVSMSTLLFQATHHTDNWWGDLLAFKFHQNSVLDRDNNNVIDDNDSVWQANKVLATRIGDTGAGHINREIITYNAAHNEGVAFRFPTHFTRPYIGSRGKLSRDHINDLLINAPIGANNSELAIFGANLLNYLRGDNSHEGDDIMDFRRRNKHYIGDILHSDPQYVGVPNENYPDNLESKSYFNFIHQTKRPNVIYVGANDGMLHAFNAADGQELFAYIPNLIFSNSVTAGLHKLAEQEYGHMAYVDGTPTIADVFLQYKGVDAWRTYLVGSLSAGGKGLFVLDVTDPDAVTEATANELVIGEFTHPNLGFTFSRPQIAKLNNGEWAAIFGNGYNNEGNGRAMLYLLYLESGEVDIIDTSAGTLGVNGTCSVSDIGSDCNGLSSPSLVDLDGNFTVDRVYAGDLHGNIWVFDITDPGANNRFDHSDAHVVTKLFQACLSDICNVRTRQSITSKPAVIAHPTRRANSTSPNLLIMFGTGQHFAKNNNINSSVHSIYGICDAGINSRKFSRGDLEVQIITDHRVMNGRVVRSISDHSAPDSFVIPRNVGWLIDFPQTGEYMVQTPLIFDDIVFFTTAVPNASEYGADGRGFLMAVDSINGGEPDVTVFSDSDDPSDSITVSGIYLNGTSSAPVVIDNTLNMVISGFYGDSHSLMQLKTQTVKDAATRENGRISWSIIH